MQPIFRVCHFSHLYNFEVYYCYLSNRIGFENADSLAGGQLAQFSVI